MTSGIERVRGIMAGAVDVDMPEGLSPPADDASPDMPGWDDGDLPPPRTPDQDEEQPPAARCVEFPLNDFGNGKRLLEHFGQDLVNVPNAGFFVWDGRRYTKDPDGVFVRRLAHLLTELISQEVWFLPVDEEDEAVLREVEEAKEEVAELLDKGKERDQVDEKRLAFLVALRKEADRIREKRDKSIGRRLTHAKNAGNSNAIKNLLTEAAAIIARPLEDLDRDPLLINTLGGVLRLSTEPGEDDGGQFAPPPRAVLTHLDHDRAFLLTKIMPVDYDPKARCPRFMAFIEQIQPVPEMRRFLQRWFGYSLTGLTAEQKFAFFYGGGANGKSVLVDLIARIMGDYAAGAKIESITGKNRRSGSEATPDLMPMIGARFLRMAEPDDGQRLQEGLVKELTGGEPILVRPPYGVNFLEVYPIFKLTISGNHKPEIHGGDDGIWRRVMLVPFDVQIPPDERDPDLGAKLWEERAGILNWLIEGLKDYLAHGLQVPDQVLAATAEYRDDSDPIATFLTSCCGVTGNPEHSMRSADLGAAVALWMDELGMGAFTSRTIYKKLSGKAGKWKSPHTGQTFTKRKSSDPFYDGISLLSPFRERFEQHQSDQALARARRQHSEAS